MLQSATRSPQQKSKLTKGLLIVFTLTLISSFGMALLSNLTGGYSTVLNNEDIALIQLDPPKTGDPVAVMHTTMGDMTYTLYPEQCPETVANFCKLAEAGYYNDTYVFHVEPQIFFSGGGKNPEGTLSETEAASAQERIPQELSPKLWPLRGALCALETKTEGGIWKTLTKTRDHFTGSRFLVVDTVEMTEEMKNGLHVEDNEALNRVGEALIEKGGIPNYAQQLTVFGQLQDGFEVLDAITDAKVTGEGESKKPAEEIRITGIEITKAP